MVLDLLNLDLDLRCLVLRFFRFLSFDRQEIVVNDLLLALEGKAVVGPLHLVDLVLRFEYVLELDEQLDRLLQGVECGRAISKELSQRQVLDLGFSVSNFLAIFHGASGALSRCRLPPVRGLRRILGFARVHEGSDILFGSSVLVSDPLVADDVDDGGSLVLVEGKHVSDEVFEVGIELERRTLILAQVALVLDPELFSRVTLVQPLIVRVLLCSLVEGRVAGHEREEDDTEGEDVYRGSLVRQTLEELRRHMIDGADSAPHLARA